MRVKASLVPVGTEPSGDGVTDERGVIPGALCMQPWRKGDSQNRSLKSTRLSKLCQDC